MRRLIERTMGWDYLSEEERDFRFDLLRVSLYNGISWLGVAAALLALAVLLG